MSARVESLYTVPASTTVSVSSGALTSAVSVTLPAASYFHTSAGGVSSGVTALQTAINSAVSPYPDNAASMAAACGYGTWSAGWSFQIASGNDTGMFGGVTMAAVSTPLYSITGPGHGGDVAVGFDSGSDQFTAGDNFDVNGTADLVIGIVFKAQTGSANAGVIQKWSGSAGWWFFQNTTGAIGAYVGDGVNAETFSAAVPVAGEWQAGLLYIDRTAGKIGIAHKSLTTGAVISASGNIGSIGDCSNATNMSIGNDGIFGGTDSPDIAFVAIGAGAGVASGIHTNIASAVASFASAVSSAFTVAIDTTSTGLVTCSNSFWPCSVAWTSTALRDALGFDRNFDYPQTAAQLTTALGGYGVFTSGAGYLCNEASGDLASVFGTPAALADSGSPTYSNYGPRGGNDKSIGFAAGGGTVFDGGDVFDVGASDDLVIVWVGYFSSIVASAGTLFSKRDSPGWLVLADTSGYLQFNIYDGVDSASGYTATTGQLAGEWHVGIAVVDRSASTCRIGTYGLVGGTSVVSATGSTTNIGDTSHAVAFKVGGYSGTPDEFKLAYFAVASGVGVATGLSANLSTALASFAAYMKSQTGTEQAQFLWFPGSPLNVDDHPSMAPEETDLRTSESPTKFALGLSGNVGYAHTNVRWERVDVSRIREAEATYANASLEVFFRDAITGLGAHAWGGPCRDMQIIWSNQGTDAWLGADGNSGAGMAGWRLVGVSKFKDIAVPSQPGWVGQFDVRFPRLVADD